MMRATVRSISFLALLGAAPAVAQAQETEAHAEAVEAVEAVAATEEVEVAVEEVAAEEAAEPEMPAPTYILSGPGRFLEAYGGEEWLAPETEICLEEGEVVQLARPEAQVASMELRGALCTTIAQALDAATIVIESAAPRPVVRTAATRGVGSSASGPQQTIIRVAAGSRDVLEQFPRGTRVTPETPICLERGQQVTLVTSTGQRVTYRGPGCARRSTRSTGDNLGGFTFGWNGLSERSQLVALP